MHDIERVSARKLNHHARQRGILECDFVIAIACSDLRPCSSPHTQPWPQSRSNFFYLLSTGFALPVPTASAQQPMWLRTSADGTKWMLFPVVQTDLEHTKDRHSPSSSWRSLLQDAKFVLRHR